VYLPCRRNHAIGHRGRLSRNIYLATMSDGNTTILRTGRMCVFDMAVDCLKKAGVPHFTTQETLSGIVSALPAMPTGGPGIWFVIRVDEQYIGEAKAVLDTLPFPTGTDPDVWDCAPQGKELPKWVQIGFILFLIAAAIWLIYGAIIRPLL